MALTNLAFRVCNDIARSQALPVRILANFTFVRNYSSHPDVTALQLLDKDFRNLPIAHVKASYNNTIITITDMKGKTIDWASGGTEGFKNAKRSTTYAGQSAGEAAAKKAIKKGIDKVRVKVKGMGPGREASLQGLQMGGLEVVSITDVTPIPHNGCKPKKTRRL